MHVFIKYKKDHDKVLSFIEEHFLDCLKEKIPDNEGVLHGYRVMDYYSGEEVTIGWDYVLKQVMYIRSCQPLMFCSDFGEVKEV